MTQAVGPDLLAPGSMVGPWRLERRVGRGSYGVVFQATNTANPESDPVALKLAVYPEDPRFAREVELLRRIRHPAVPALVDQGVWNAPGGEVHPYIVMQWVEGLSLYEWARIYNPTSRQVLHVLAQVAWALATMDEELCLHRDVKGDNIKVRRDGRAFLMDFGSGIWAGAPRITEGPMAPGTRDYRAPEAVRFQWYYRRGSTEVYEAREADDIYSLGVLAYRVVTGRYPPPGTDPEMQLDPEREPPPPRLPPQAVNARVVPELAALIERMLAEVPQARPDARAVALAAQMVAERADTEADVPLAPSKKQSIDCPFPPPAPERRWWLLPVALCFLGGMWCVARRPVVSVFEQRAVAPGADKPNASSSGVAEAVSTAPRASVGVKEQARVVSGLQLPPKPLPQQKKPDGKGSCPRDYVAINGGCWILVSVKLPCEEGEYEWQGGCYHPFLVGTRQPTSGEQ